MREHICIIIIEFNLMSPIAEEFGRDNIVV